MSLKITDVQVGKKSFQNDLAKLPPEVLASLPDRIAELLADPRPGRLRLHDLTGKKPKIWKIDLTSGRGQRYQATFHLEGSTAVFLRAGSHKRIDRCPD